MPKQILVVEDHPDSACALVRLLRHDGHHVAMAQSQADALVLAARLPPD